VIGDHRHDQVQGNAAARNTLLFDRALPPNTNVLLKVASDHRCQRSLGKR
jgi:hypothetical protein